MIKNLEYNIPRAALFLALPYSVGLLNVVFLIYSPPPPTKKKQNKTKILSGHLASFFLFFIFLSLFLCQLDVLKKRVSPTASVILTCFK